MKAFLAAIVAMGLIGFIASTILESRQMTAEHEFATSSVRLPAAH